MVHSFGRVGCVSSVQAKGFAFVQFVIPADARKAMEELDRHAFRGRLLHIIPARRQPGESGTAALGNGSRCANIIKAGLLFRQGPSVTPVAPLQAAKLSVSNICLLVCVCANPNDFAPQSSLPGDATSRESENETAHVLRA